MEYKDVNDYELLYMVADDSDEYIGVLFEKYQPVIEQQVWKWSAIFKKFGLEIEDVEQEIYYAFVQAVRNYDEEQSATLYTYCMKVINNTMRKIVRFYSTNRNQVLNEAVLLSTPCGEDLELADYLEDLKASVENQIETFHLQSDIYQFCYSLPIEQASVFELYISGFGNKKIEYLLELETASLPNLLFRLKKRLKKYLIKTGYLIQ